MWGNYKNLIFIFHDASQLSVSSFSSSKPKQEFGDKILYLYKKDKGKLPSADLQPQEGYTKMMIYFKLKDLKQMYFTIYFNFFFLLNKLSTDLNITSYYVNL
jgi:hypothetical protein